MGLIIESGSNAIIRLVASAPLVEVRRNIHRCSMDNHNQFSIRDRIQHLARAREALDDLWFLNDDQHGLNHAIEETLRDMEDSRTCRTCWDPPTNVTSRPLRGQSQELVSLPKGRHKSLATCVKSGDSVDTIGLAVLFTREEYSGT